MYKNDTSKGGASNWPVVMMVKCMMLQRWFNLSDPMLEEMLLGEHDHVDKRWMFEESLKMPFLVRYPKEIAANSINDDIINNVDFAKPCNERFISPLSVYKTHLVSNYSAKHQNIIVGILFFR